MKYRVTIDLNVEFGEGHDGTWRYEIGHCGRKFWEVLPTEAEAQAALDAKLKEIGAESVEEEG